MGNVDGAKKSLRSALQQQSSPDKKFSDEPAYVLVLEPTGKKASPHKDLPVAASILINLRRIDDCTQEELETELAGRYPERAQTLLARFIGT